MTASTSPLPRTRLRIPARTQVLILLCLMYAISYIDRANIATAAPSIQSALGLSDSQLGIALSAFSIPYALLSAFGGTIGERFGPRKALTVIAVLWGVATVLTGFSVGLASLVGARLLLGLSESGAFPVATQAMSRWMSAKRYGAAQGIVHSASRLGNAVAPLLVAGLIVWGGWRASFFVIGALSVAWALLWVALFRTRPGDHRGITPGELAELQPVAAKAIRPPVPWRRLILTLLPVVFVDFGYGWTLWVFLTWLPSFLSKSFGLSLSSFALFSSLVLAAGVVGDTVGGLFTDFLAKRMRRVNTARRTSIIIGLTGSLLALLPLVFTHQLLVATASLAVSFFFLELTNAPLWAIPMDVAPAWPGTASGIMNTGFGIAGVFSPLVFGFLVQASGWQLPFVLSIVLLAAAAVVAAVMRPLPLPVPQSSDPAESPHPHAIHPG